MRCSSIKASRQGYSGKSPLLPAILAKTCKAIINKPGETSARLTQTRIVTASTPVVYYTYTSPLAFLSQFSILSSPQSCSGTLVSAWLHFHWPLPPHRLWQRGYPSPNLPADAQDSHPYALYLTSRYRICKRSAILPLDTSRRVILPAF
jgi:hypothetical protein